MKCLSVTDVVTIHDRYVRAFGGSLGIRSDELLESAVFRCQASYGGEDLYPTVFEKAAALFHGIIFDHPFVDGNKRTSLFSAVRLLYINGYKFTATNREATEFPLFVEHTRPEIPAIASWFKSHCRRRKRYSMLLQPKATYPPS